MVDWWRALTSILKLCFILLSKVNTIPISFELIEIFPKIIDKISVCKNRSQDLNHFGVKLHQPAINYVVEDVIDIFETIVNECFKFSKKNLDFI